MKEEIKFENGELIITKTYEFTDTHKAALKQLVRDGLFEYRGKVKAEEADIYSELELMELAKDIDGAWHTSWKPTANGKFIASQFEKEVIIKEGIEEDYWYTNLAGQAFTIRQANNKTEVREMFYGQANSEDVWIVTEGDHIGNGILKKHCK